MAVDTLSGYMRVIEEQENRRREQERQRKKALAPELVRIADLVFGEMVLEAYKLHRSGLMTGQEFVELVFKTAHSELGLPPDE